ncbi:Type-4 uracil-DNA glycosylase [Bordetella sputigena]|uniref:uracil-DNA glycosylase n=1 Tax=Bordetella sputigena TaxID=1416810 RepID=UPI0039EE6ED0
MVDATAMAGKVPALNPLQRAWLREIGMEKVWLRQDASQPRSPAAPVPARAGSGAVDGAGDSAAGGVQDGPLPKTGASADADSGAGADAAVAGDTPGAGHAAVTGDTVARGVPIGVDAATAGGVKPGAASAPQARPPARPVKPAPAGAGSEPAPLQPPPTAESLAMLDMASLRERVLECTACGLCRGRRQAVFGMGAEQARWLVVGEAPGEQEDRQGLPFVGRSGQLLDAMLAAVGMGRDRDVYIANVIKCRPPGNRNPKPEEIAACRPYLMRQIALLKPQRILVLGRFAAQTLLETDAAIGSLRGRVHALKTDAGEIPMVVSYHPAYLLRSPGEKARAWQDLRLAASL